VTQALTREKLHFIFLIDHTYEIESADARFKENKLYSRSFTAEELEGMAEKVGTFFA
jgi:hypothetical protein